MPELNTEQPEEIIKLNSVWYHSVKSGYLDDFPKSLVLYVETAYDLQVNQVIAGNLDKIQKIYKTYDQSFLYLPLLLQEGANVFEHIYPGAELDQTITPENVTSVITAKLFAELNVSQDFQGAMLLTYDDKQESGWVVTRLRCGIHIGQLFQTHAKMYWHYDYCKYSQVLHGSESDEEYTKDPERHFDAEVSRIVSEIDERISLLKRMGLYRLLTDTVAPMLTPQLSRLCITEDFRLFLADYNNMEIPMNPLSKVVYFLFLRHPEGIFIKNLSLYQYELTQIYRLLSNRESLKDMDESIRKLTDPSDNSIYEKCSRIKREFLRNISDTLAQNYYIKGNFGQPKRIELSRTLIDLPDALKNIQVPREILMDIMVVHTHQLMLRIPR